jgi:hypothetical protein
MNAEIRTMNPVNTNPTTAAPAAATPAKKVATKTAAPKKPVKKASAFAQKSKNTTAGKKASFAAGEGIFRSALPFSSAAIGGGEAQEQFSKFNREATEQFSKFAEGFGQGFGDTAQQIQGAFEATAEVGNLTADMGRALAGEMMRFANDTFSDNVEISKEIFDCKTMSDVIEMQSKALRSNMDHFFNQTDKVSEMFFQFVADAAEPFTQRFGGEAKKKKSSK